MRDDDGDEENNLRVARESLDRMMCLVRVGKGDRILKTPTNAKFMGGGFTVCLAPQRLVNFLRPSGQAGEEAEVERGGHA